MQNTTDSDYTSLGDSLLVRLLRTDDEDAFQEIYRRYWHALFVMARRKLHSHEDAEEVVQELFLGIWSRRAEAQIEDLKNYLFSAVKYRIINTIKSKLVRREYEAFETSAQGLDSTHQHTEEELAYHDLYEAIEEGLRQLPDKTQNIFRLNRLDSKSVREISSLLDVPERTVEYHIAKAIRVLRIHLREYMIPAFLAFILSDTLLFALAFPQLG